VSNLARFRSGYPFVLTRESMLESVAGLRG
jgi:hypothetical protein